MKHMLPAFGASILVLVALAPPGFAAPASAEANSLIEAAAQRPCVTDRSLVSGAAALVTNEPASDQPAIRGRILLAQENSDTANDNDNSADSDNNSADSDNNSGNADNQNSANADQNSDPDNSTDTDQNAQANDNGDSTDQNSGDSSDSQADNGGGSDDQNTDPDAAAR